MNKPEEKKIYATLEKIETSEAFFASERNIRILRFLVECHLKDVFVKETVIATELFKDNKDILAYDGKVRGYMYHLRKKLEEYYQSEGSKDPIIFSIKKGQYNLSINNKHRSIKIPHRYKNIIKSLLATVLIVSVFFFFLKINKAEYCWSPFFDKEANNICCIGDHYLMIGDIWDKDTVAFYYHKINSDEEFHTYRKKDKNIQYDLKKASFSFSTKMGAISSAQLARWFERNGSTFNVIVDSELSTNNLKNNNIIYVGSYKTMDKLKGLFLNNSKRFGFTGSNLYFKGTGKKIRNKKIENAMKDYVIVSFNRLTDSGNDILFFASNNDIGVVAAVEKFTNPEWLKSFYKQLPSKYSYFNALLEIEGINRTNLSCNIREIEILKE